MDRLTRDELENLAEALDTEVMIKIRPNKSVNTTNPKYQINIDGQIRVSHNSFIEAVDLLKKRVYKNQTELFEAATKTAKKAQSILDKVTL